MSLISMSQQAWAIANQAFAYVWHVFDQLLRATGMKDIYIIMVLLVIAFRLLAAPLVGAALTAGSDTYKALKAKNPTSDSKELSRIN